MRALFALVFLVGLLPVAAHAADPVGVWSAGEGKIRVKIDPCGEVLCGKIVWVSEAEAQEASRKGQPPIIGVQLLSDLKPSSDRADQWEGKVYNLQDGRTYNVFLRPGNKQMEVEGCLLIFCRTQVWPRVEESGAVQGQDHGMGQHVDDDPTIGTPPAILLARRADRAASPRTRLYS